MLERETESDALIRFMPVTVVVHGTRSAPDLVHLVSRLTPFATLCFGEL